MLVYLMLQPRYRNGKVVLCIPGNIPGNNTSDETRLVKGDIRPEKPCGRTERAGWSVSSTRRVTYLFARMSNNSSCSTWYMPLTFVCL